MSSRRKAVYCSDRTKLLTFGWIRQMQQICLYTIPMVIKLLCLNYVNSDDIWNDQSDETNQIVIIDKII